MWLKLHSINFWSSNFRNNAFIFQKHNKNTQIQVNILPFSKIITSYNYQNNSIYVKIRRDVNNNQQEKKHPFL